jgi:hypothetical protein
MRVINNLCPFPRSNLQVTAAGWKRKKRGKLHLEVIVLLRVWQRKSNHRDAVAASSFSNSHTRRSPNGFVKHARYHRLFSPALCFWMKIICLPLIDEKSCAESSDNVKVCVRIRPLSKKESEAGANCVYTRANTLILDAKPQGKSFTYDYVADESVSQVRSCPALKWLAQLARKRPCPLGIFFV